MHSFHRCLSLAFAAFLITGCATTGTPSSSRSMVAPYQETISLEGQLLVNYDREGKRETLSGKFAWNQKPGLIDVALMSPLGQTIATIAVTPQSATLTQSNGQSRSAADIDTLTAQTLGWSLPVNGLRDWMQGHATVAGGQGFAASPANNTVTTADGWRLVFVSWQDESAARPVPKRIDATRAASGTTGELALRIVVQQRN